jgi:hypothetical protein
MKAIVTKFHAPGNVRGSRYSASDLDGNRVILGTDHALGSEQNHDRAALALCRKMHWTGELLRGSTKTGHVYVWASSEKLAAG